MKKPGPLRIAKYRCEKYLLAALESLMPPERIPISEWVEKYVVLNGKTSAESGTWANRKTPYLVEIMDAMLDPEIFELILVKPTQIGGTAGMLNVILYFLAQDPAPIEVVYPNQDTAQSISTKRLQPMIRECEPLKKKFRETESRDLELDFLDEGMVKLVGSNSPTGVASFAMKYLFIDEIDKFHGASKREADPVSLAQERIKTFRAHGAKIFKTSTPTLRDGYIWKAKESADIEKHYFIPCPHCGEYIELKFSNLRWPGRNKDFQEAYDTKDIQSQMDELAELEQAPEGLSDTDRAEFAFYICQECGKPITDQQKNRAMVKGKWEPVVKRARTGRKVCFWLNTLYSPFVKFSEIALEFMNSKDDPEKLQNFTNSWLAEPWENTKLKTTAEIVLERQTELPAYTVPEWASLLTGGVDVQQGYFYWTIRAWGEYLTSQNIAHGQAQTFEELEAIMNTEFVREDGVSMLVELAVVDSGYNSDDVYDFCLRNSEWAIPGKGASHEMDAHYRIGTVNKAGSTATGMRLVFVDGGKYKDMIAARMRRPNGKGSWMVYKGCDMEYAEQVTAEHKIAVKSGNKTVMRWEPKESHADNHYLDCEVYAMAAADMCEVRMLHLQRVQPVQPAEPQQQEEQLVNEGSWIENQEDWI